MGTGLRLRIGTRRSALARWQAEWVASRLRDVGVETELVFLSTRGDQQAGPIGSLGGVGVFTRTIQQALIAGEVDLAVHSLKDLPTEPVAGLTIGAVPEREAPGDVLVSQRDTPLDQLPSGAVVGTGSLRRQAQLLHVRSDLAVHPIRGNVDTRLKKLDEGAYEAIVLAEAGLTRLGLESRISQRLPLDVVLPAVGQGALGLEIRDGDKSVLQHVQKLDHRPSHAAVTAERAMLATLRGGCLAPVGARGRVEDGESLVLDGVVLSCDGSRRVSASVSGIISDAEQIGCRVAEELIARGASDLIGQSRDASG